MSKKNLQSVARKEIENPSGVSEPSPTPIGAIFQNEAKRSSRASERTAPPPPPPVEVRDLKSRLEARVKELREAMAELPDTFKARHVDAKRRQKLGAMLTKAEKQLRDIRQIRLF